MNDSSFEGYGYRILKKLGQNYQGGRYTYKAEKIKTGQLVVIKQFKFLSSSDWMGYKAVEREIEVLKGLDHPGIPQIIDSFEKSDGICLVQEYKNAQPLSVKRKFTPEQIKHIAVQVLKILIYLQKQIPPIIHRDIKPDNVLLDRESNVYLVDFGLARIGGGEVVTQSSVVAGTPGFMPPEQLLNRPLTKASDLYGLGATLICLLTGTPPEQVNSLVDTHFRFHFQHLLPQINIRFVRWLQKMVQPNLYDRFANAGSALQALKPIPVEGIPEIKISPSYLQMGATKVGEVLMQTVTVRNIVPETLLEATWQVSEPTAEWLSVEPVQFADNVQECQIIVDTSKLRAQQVYARQIVLKTNALTRTHTLTIQVTTAPIPVAVRKLPYYSLGLWLLITWIGTAVVAIAPDHARVGAIIGAVIGIVLGTILNAVKGALTGTLIGAFSGAVVGASGRIGARIGVGTVGGAITGFVLVSLAITVVIDLLSRATERRLGVKGAIALLLLTTVNGISLGLGTIFGFDYQWMLFVVATALPLGGIAIYFPLYRQRLIERYRRRESKQNLIEP